ncbi:hypothetical protein IEQ34_015088 [Dendrobium chrysotoxum]|uniref:DNA-directed RNA polymerase II subunit RPB9-like zinc ribbon domain-containing protein n=1 Tax=Dendrobium chrysotoxum TaxID=161865 RepID=A0AAV7GL20_DENCH|nr:hypothetical protein IEQ34_015088 [Dendrobium chrysotoxum]
MQFCPDCRNLLYKKEDKKENMLVIACRICPYQEKVEGKNKMRHETNPTEPPLILRDAYEDPTLPREKGVSCPVCGHPRVVWFYGNRESMVQTFACCNPKCRHNWTNHA